MFDRMNELNIIKEKYKRHPHILSCVEKAAPLSTCADKSDRS
jgi:hypothetical protein